MTATTPKLGLRYPQGTDSPCEGGQQLIDLRDDIYAYLDDYTGIVARQADLPMVSVAWAGPGQLLPEGNVPFHIVEQDDLRAADLITASDRIVLGQPGFEGTYLAGFMIAGEEEPIFEAAMVGDTVNTFTPIDADLDSWWLDPNFTIYYPTMSGSTLALIGGPTVMTLSPAPFFIQMARMWAVRIGGL